MRFLRYFVLITVSILWAAGVSTTVAHWLYEAGIIADDYRYGDLYRISALPRFKEEAPVCPVEKRDSDTASTHLYIIGDSFSEEQRIGKSDFRVSHYQRVKWDMVQRAQLDPARRNVLLLETVERHFRDHFTRPRPVDELVIQSDTNRNPEPKSPWRQRLGQEFHRTNVDERLESALFSQDWAFWFKELKASLTLNWFDRYNTGVSLSRDRQAIFLNSDTDTSTVLSSYSRLSDTQVNNLVDSVNAVAERYKQLGFDEVYLTIIPNKATILEPDRGVYNHLIERVQQHPRLAVPTVNIYDTFRTDPQPPYLKSDTHWNCQGRSQWLNAVRRRLGV